MTERAKLVDEFQLFYWNPGWLKLRLQERLHLEILWCAFRWVVAESWYALAECYKGNVNKNLALIILVF